MTEPLSGTTIVERVFPSTPLPTRLAIALAGRVAADLGGRVVVLEPPDGDPLRRLPPFLDRGPNGERSALFQFLNASKRSCVLDERSEGQRLAAERLLAGADAVMTDGDAAPARPRPPLTISVTPLGWAAGGRTEAVSEFTVLALGGLLDILGDPEREPLRLAGHQAAYAAGLAAFTALAAGLLADPAEGGGEVVDVSLLDVCHWLNWKSLSVTVDSGQPPGRLGPREEWRVVPCADGHVAVVFLERDWPALCALVGDPELAGAPFGERESRARRIDELYERVLPWFATRSRHDIYRAAQERGVPLGPVRTIDELRADPQYVARAFLTKVRHALLGDLVVPRLPLLWDGEGFAPRPAPTLGGGGEA